MKPGTVAVGFLDPGEWSRVFGRSLIDLLMVDAHGPKRVVPHGKLIEDVVSAGGLVDGRNRVVKEFLKTDCEWLFWLDSDMGFAADSLERLLEAADADLRPVVGGLCFSLRKDTAGAFYGQKYVVVPTCYEYVDNESEVGFRSILDYPENAVIPVGGTGSACILIHRSAFEKVAAKWGEHWYDTIRHPHTDTTFSEDLSFCLRLAGEGIPVVVHTGVETTHDKGGVFLDQDEYDRCRALHRVDA